MHRNRKAVALFRRDVTIARRRNSERLAPLLLNPRKAHYGWRLLRPTTNHTSGYECPRAHVHSQALVNDTGRIATRELKYKDISRVPSDTAMRGLDPRHRYPSFRSSPQPRSLPAESQELANCKKGPDRRLPLAERERCV